MSTHEGLEPTAQEREQFAASAGDLHAAVAADGTVLWWSDDVHPVGLPLADALAADDGRLVPVVLGTSATGPHWLRLQDARGHGRWMAVFAVPREHGWIVEFRDVRTLGPAAGVPQPQGAITDRDQVVNEVAWLLSATPRTGKETAVVTCELTALPDVTREHGRLASEEVIEVISGRISDALRSGDLVARIDATRLLVLLRGVIDLKGAVSVVDRIQEAVVEPVVLDEYEIEQEMCAGVTLISRGESVDSVLERSEGALDLAVAAGPGRVITSPPM
jgi:GGDEF domain-containing protein